MKFCCSRLSSLGPQEIKKSKASEIKGKGHQEEAIGNNVGCCRELREDEKWKE